MKLTTEGGYAPLSPLPGDDVWLPSSCALCYGTCSILAHREHGVITKIEGNPASVTGKGKLCGKGVSGLMTHYDPHRLKVPLKRTNPNKGLDQDPRWQEISWEEALDTVAARLAEVRADDPRKLTVQRTTTVTASRNPLGAFAAGFGTPNISTGGGGIHCGNGAHLISGTMHSSWSIVPDFEHCNYAIYFGASKGHGAGHASCSNMALAADARARGMKMVVVDPMCNFASAKASEWVPIKVGTDAALALSMCHVLVHELDQLDRPYLKAKTNGSYLLGPDGQYLRDPGSGDPLVWDLEAGRAVRYTAAASAVMALEGTYQVHGVDAIPAFKALKEHLAKHTPEWAEQVSTIPAATIRRLAGEFADQACIGRMTEIEGVEIPYRPVAAIAFRGNQGHLNSVYNFLAVDLLNQLVGAADMVGSCLGFNPACHGYPETGRLRYIPHAGKDGLMEVGMWMGFHNPYPVVDPVLPQKSGLQDLFTMGMTSPILDSVDQEALWQAFDLPYRPEMMLNFGANLLMSVGNREAVAASLAKYRFVASFDLFETETTRFSDIVFPDCSYLEGVDSRSNFPFIFNLPAGMGEWSWSVRQPIVQPDGKQRYFADVLLELANRAGFREDLNAALNASLDLKSPHRLRPGDRVDYAEVCNRDLKDKFGDDKGLDWFRRHGVLKWKKKPEEVYWRHFEKVRVPIYWEWMRPLGEKIAAIAEPRGVPIRREFFEPLPDHIACTSHVDHAEGFDLTAFYYRDSVHTNSFTMENPWLDEAAKLDPYSYTVAVNADTCARLGLEDGQPVRIETERGKAIDGRLRAMQGIHPNGVGIAACAGHWGDGMPVAKGKGLFFNQLLEIDMAYINPVNLGLDVCAQVRVVPIAEGELRGIVS